MPATVAALPNERGFDWEAVEELPNVAAIARFPVSQSYIKDLPPEAGNFAYGDGAMIDIERPVVLEGRLADPSRDDEAVITEAFEGTTGKGVGDTVTIQLLTPEQVDETYLSAEAPPPEGPEIETTIVGVVRSPWFSDSVDQPLGSLIPSNGLFDQHAANLIGNTEVANINALVRLDGGADAVPGFREDLAELTGRRDIEFFDLAAMADHAADVAGFEADALLAFAAAALIAAVFLIGQSVVRYVSSASQDLQILSAAGMPPRHVRIAATAGPAIAAVAGTAVGVIAAWLASSRFPTGTAAPFEPTPGRHADLAVLLTGLVLIPLAVVGGALLDVLGRVAAPSVPCGRSRRSRVAGLAARAGAPVPADGRRQLRPRPRPWRAGGARVPCPPGRGGRRARCGGGADVRGGGRRRGRPPGALRAGVRAPAVHGVQRRGLRPPRRRPRGARAPTLTSPRSTTRARACWSRAGPTWPPSSSTLWTTRSRSCVLDGHLPPAR